MEVTVAWYIRLSLRHFPSRGQLSLILQLQLLSWGSSADFLITLALCEDIICLIFCVVLFLV